MNITDVADPTDIPTSPRDLADLILQRQAKLEAHYISIEKRPTQFFDIDTRTGQIWIKDFLWRITEELGEAIEADVLEHNVQKVQEELADALHFIAGLSLNTQNDESFKQAFEEFYYENPNPKPMPQRIATDFCVTVMYLGMVGNTLKLKPWKQTDVVTDQAYFRYCLRKAVQAYLELCLHTGLPMDELYKLYFKKSEVNFFRIKSNY